MSPRVGVVPVPVALAEQDQRGSQKLFQLVGNVLLNSGIVDSPFQPIEYSEPFSNLPDRDSPRIRSQVGRPGFDDELLLKTGRSN